MVIVGSQKEISRACLMQLVMLLQNSPPPGELEGAFPGGPLIFYNYKYDQLNRLTGQDTYNGFLRDQNKWDNMSSMGETAKERVAYDANGNIQKYLRKSMQGGIMDSLHYRYYANTNQLRFITDSVAPNGYDGGPDHLIVDIDKQADSNYVYDSIGNLIVDKAEKITGIK
jgi:hypothetical protein